MRFSLEVRPHLTSLLAFPPAAISDPFELNTRPDPLPVAPFLTSPVGVKTRPDPIITLPVVSVLLHMLESRQDQIQSNANGSSDPNFTGRRADKTRSVSVRCVTPVQVLKLSKEDFEAGFGCKSLRSAGEENTEESTGDEAALRARLIAFILMVNRSRGHTLRRGDTMFREGQMSHLSHGLPSLSTLLSCPPPPSLISAASLAARFLNHASLDPRAAQVIVWTTFTS